jgi:DNA-binding transcriptional LysR family regulator
LRQYAVTAPKWLAFGCIPTLAVSQIVRPLAAFAGAYPDLAVRAFDSPAEELAELVESGAAAFAVSLGSPTRATLTQDAFAQEPFVLVCHASHPLANASRVTWDQLRREMLIRISLSTGNASKIDEALGAKRLDLRWGYEAQGTGVALQMVSARLGVTVAPALSIQSVPDLVAVPLVEPVIDRFLTVVTAKEGRLSVAAEKLRDLLIEEIRANLAPNSI